MPWRTEDKGGVSPAFVPVRHGFYTGIQWVLQTLNVRFLPPTMGERWGRGTEARGVGYPASLKQHHFEW
jgi:hypothetical protein